MPDYSVERAIRRAPSAFGSLMKRVGLLTEPATTDAADEMHRWRGEEMPAPTSGLDAGVRRVMGALGVFPLPDETKAQFDDAVWGTPSTWFPTAGLAKRAAQGAPRDVNLPNEQPVTDARWLNYYRERR